jgi:5-methylcytosine-specific restriction endonuclease McrA
MSTDQLRDGFSRHFLSRFLPVQGASQRTEAKWELGPGRKGKVTATCLNTVYVRDGNRCSLCGHKILANEPKDSAKTLTPDHILPLRLNGTYAEENLYATHAQCNQTRGLIPYPETIIAADDYRCQRCGREIALTESPFSPMQGIVEHLVPIDSPEMWYANSAWAAHRGCHRPDTRPALEYCTSRHRYDVEAIGSLVLGRPDVPALPHSLYPVIPYLDTPAIPAIPDPWSNRWVQIISDADQIHVYAEENTITLQVRHEVQDPLSCDIPLRATVELTPTHSFCIAQELLRHALPYVHVADVS